MRSHWPAPLLTASTGEGRAAKVSKHHAAGQLVAINSATEFERQWHSVRNRHLPSYWLPLTVPSKISAVLPSATWLPVSVPPCPFSREWRDAHPLALILQGSNCHLLSRNGLLVRIVYKSLSGRQFIEELLGFFQIARIKPLGKPPINRNQQFARFPAPCPARARGARGSQRRGVPST